MIRRLCIAVVAGLGAVGCQEPSERGAASAKTDTVHAAAMEDGSASAPPLEGALSARVKRISQLSRSCAPTDWGELVLMATSRYDWPEDAATSDPAAADKVQCAAVDALFEVMHLSPVDHMVVRRTFAAGFEEPRVLSALRDAISGQVRFPLRCDPGGTIAFIVDFAPLHQLRPEIKAHAPWVLRSLDRDRSYKIGAGATQIERWAAELTPDGFTRVLDVLAPDFNWNGSRKPSAAEKQTAIDMIWWLGLLVWGEPRSDCEEALQKAVAEGELGDLIVKRLDHPSDRLKIALLRVLKAIPRPGSKERLVDLEHKDPDAAVRRLARSAIDWFDRGGESKDIIMKHQQERTDRAADLARRRVPP
jgi:hypothetical protein